MANASARIMNLQPGSDMPESNPSRGQYKAGHRDARHAAAEIAIEVENSLEDLIQSVKEHASPEQQETILSVLDEQ